MARDPAVEQKIKSLLTNAADSWRRTAYHEAMGLLADARRLDPDAVTGAYDAGLAKIAEQLATAPQDTRLQATRARILMAKGDRAEAIAAYEELLGREPTDANYVSYGRALRDAAALEEAVAVFRRAIAQPPHGIKDDLGFTKGAVAKGSFEFEIALVLEAKGDVEGALAALKAATDREKQFRQNAWHQFGPLKSDPRFSEYCGALPADPAIRELYERLEEDPYEAMLAAQELAGRTGDEHAVRCAEREALRVMLSDMDEHGRNDEYGGLSFDELKRKKDEVEGRLAALERADSTSRVWADYLRSQGRSPGK